MSEFLFYFQKSSYLIPDAQYDIIAGVKWPKLRPNPLLKPKFRDLLACIAPELDENVFLYQFDSLYISQSWKTIDSGL